MEFLRLVKIAKNFNGTAVIRDFSLTVGMGEFLGLLGPSGCGKTTILRMIAGLEEPDSGEIYLGENLVNNPKILLPAQKRNVGMVFQDSALWPHMTARQHLEFVFSCRDKIKNQKSPLMADPERIFTIVSFPVGLADRYPHQLSGGERQRLALARALAQEPKILLLDEPLVNLDYKLKEEIRGELKRLHQKLGMTTIYVTHDPRELENLASRTVELSAS